MASLFDEKLPLRAGGKAYGQSRLKQAGLAVPEGIVVLPAHDGSLPVELAAFCTSVKGALVVRSSAHLEDGPDLSYAGQFESVLNLHGEEAVRAAIAHCQTATQPAAAYAQQLGQAGDEARPHSIAVIVQRMISARCSGVLFTVDPLTGAADRMVLEVIAGTSEKLTAGRANAQRYVLSAQGALLDGPAVEVQLLDEHVLRKIFLDAQHAQKHLGPALDLEWALDLDGTIHWLQARPVTTQLEGDAALQSSPPDSSWVLTRYNIREIVPGALTPLCRDVILRGINAGFHQMSVEAGVPDERLREMPMSVCYHGHVFYNMSAQYIISEYVLGTSKTKMDYSIAGCLLPGEEAPPKSVWLRAKNMMRYMRMLHEIPQRFEDFTAQHSFENVDGICESATQATALHRALEKRREEAMRAGCIHIYTSTLAGTAYGVLCGMISQGRQPAQAEDHAKTAALLRSFEDPGISSLAIGKAMEDLAAAIRATDDAGAFQKLALVDAKRWMQNDAPSNVRSAFQQFLNHHGHRGIKECDLYEQDWAENPLPLLQSLQPMLSPSSSQNRDSDEEGRTLTALPFVLRRIVQWLLPWARRAVVLRERSKSLWVKSLRSMKPGYRALGLYLMKQQRIPESELVFFLSHEELETLLNAPSAKLVRAALRRRREHRWQSSLHFPDACIGAPQPLLTREETSASDELSGTPVSAGIAQGTARIAHTLEEAMQLQPGEILVVPYTDVGWTPLFSRAAGLATEIGGTLSHGAVVAREFGLPAVVNLPGATRWLRSGDQVFLDGRTGTLRRIKRSNSADSA